MAGLITNVPEDLLVRQSRFRGCLLGGAVGDALGAPVEFLSRERIESTFGPDGITELASAYGGVGRITDDTQMTLFTADGLIRAHVRGSTRGIIHAAGVVRNAYLRWLRTQGVMPEETRRPAPDEFGWLDAQPELHHQRAPGNTCLGALAHGDWHNGVADNDSKGCGGVMRMAPVGLYAVLGGGLVEGHDGFDLGCQFAALTHGHPSGWLTAGALAVMITALVQGADMDTALAAAEQRLSMGHEADETRQALAQARVLATGDTPPAEAIARLGEGWIAEEALAIAVYCALVARDFRDGVTLAVNHDGDSDSTGAITGNLLGARWGKAAIPDSWLKRLELHDVIEELADDLLTCNRWPISAHGDDPELGPVIFRKYPPT